MGRILGGIETVAAKLNIDIHDSLGTGKNNTSCNLRCNHVLTSTTKATPGRPNPSLKCPLSLDDVIAVVESVV